MNKLITMTLEQARLIKRAFAAAGGADSTAVDAVASIAMRRAANIGGIKEAHVVFGTWTPDANTATGKLPTFSHAGGALTLADPAALDTMILLAVQRVFDREDSKELTGALMWLSSESRK